MVAVTNLLSKYTILYGKVMMLVVTIQSVARRWTTNYDIEDGYSLETLSFDRNVKSCTYCTAEHII